MDKKELAAMVAQILETMEPTVKAGGYKPAVPGPEQKGSHFRDGDFVPDITKLDLRKLYLNEKPKDLDGFRRLKEKTPARLGSGRSGPRYKTVTMLRFRADHAAAQDAVFSEAPEDYAKENGMVEVRTRCRDKEEYLTRPDLGRCFDEHNEKVIRGVISGSPKVLIVVGDGLSSAAIEANAADCRAAIEEGLKAQSKQAAQIILPHG